jgi:seryl-tRNA synthetase
MLDIKLIRDQVDIVKNGVAAKGYKPELVDEVKTLDENRRKILIQVEALRGKRNNFTKDQVEEAKKLKTDLKTLEEDLEKISLELDQKLSVLPNLPSADTPAGKSEAENVEIRKWGIPRQFDFTPKDHLRLGTDLQILDFDSGSKVTGSQFYYLYDEATLLELALTQFTLNFLKKEGFIPVITPDMAKSRYYLGTGYAPKGDEAQTYTIEGQDLGLIATAEVTLAGKHADETIPESQLPIKYVGYSHCFRQEAGAYGKYSKGLYRVHQFSKTEMFIYCLPEDSDKYHQEILALEEKIFQALNLPYRVLQMCSGDLGAMAAKKYDIEVWMPGRNDYGEVTSTSNCTDYQARNLNIRYKKTSGETGYIHMLNGTAVVMSRVPLAILENYQNADGSITIPEVLRPYIGFDRIAK